MDIPMPSLQTNARNWQRALAVLLSICGAGLIIAGMFFPVNVFMFRGTALPTTTDFDYLKEGIYYVLGYPLLAILTPAFVLWSYRMPQVRWWTISFGAIFLFNIINLALLVPAYLQFHTLAPSISSAVVEQFGLGFYLKEGSYVLAGIGAWYAARLVVAKPALQ